MTKHEFTIKRQLNAPRDLVWKAWTLADRLAEWWGPKGFKIAVAKLNLRPGGVFHYSTTMPDGRKMWGKFVYREIVEPERIVFVNSFSDENGGVIRHPMSASWPLEVLSTVTFVEEGGRTTVTLRGAPINATPQERKTFEEGHQSMRQGFAGTLDQLDDYLTKA